MLPPTIPPTEAQRLVALWRLQILDTPQEERFDRITRLAASLFDVPIALVSLVDTQRQWFKSRVGLSACETGRDVSFCGHAILAGDVFVVPDSHADPRFADNPLVTGPPHVRSYAGAPLDLGDGTRMGTLCLIDHVPRHFEPAQLQQLADLACWVVTELEHDLTRATAVELAESQAQLQAVLDGVQEGILTLDERGHVLAANRAVERLFGHSASALIGQPVSALLAEPGRSRFAARLDRFGPAGAASSDGLAQALVGQRADGSTFPLELSLSEVEEGRDVHVVGLIRDVSRRRELAQVRGHSAAILRSSSDAIISKSLDGIISGWNPGAERLFGYTEDEAVGQPMTMLFPPEQISDEASILARIHRGEVVDHFEAVRLRRDGSEVEVSVTISPIRDEDGAIIGASKIARDITERRNVERMKQQFVSTVSHELRTPLTSIRGALSLLTDRFSDSLPPKGRRLLSMAERNSERLTVLINDILDLEKIESGLLALKLEPLDLVEVAREAVEAMEGFARGHGVGLRLDAPDHAVAVHGDAVRLGQVFANLLSNAAKFSPEGELVVVTVAVEDDRARVGVRDRGPGLPADFQPRAFERFSQADGSDAREKGGTGLGLSICKAIVNRHAGSIGFETEVGVGTAFTFDLPLLERARDSRRGGGGAAAVLICEDNPDVAEVLAELLLREGLTSERVYTAAAAQARLAEGGIALLLLDLGLPDGDGMSLVRELREAPETRELPIVVVSGGASERRATSASGVQIVDWLQKPVDQTRLREAVQRALTHTGRPRILHVEDDPDVLQVTQVLFEGIADFTTAPSRREAEALLDTEEFDLIILDLQLSDGSSVPLLRRLHGGCPVVLFSGQEAATEIVAEVAAALPKAKTTNAELVAVVRDILGSNEEA